VPRPNVGVLRDKQAFEGPRTTCGSEFPLADGLVRYSLIRVGGDCEESVSPVLFRCKFSDAHERLTGLLKSWLEGGYRTVPRSSYRVSPALLEPRVEYIRRFFDCVVDRTVKPVS